MATLAAQLTSLSEQVVSLAQLVRAQLEVRDTTTNERAEPMRDRASSVEPSTNGEGFESALLQTVADLDRRGRHTGMVPIPDLRRVFLQRGWTRPDFDERLLQAERDFVIDLKTANDPSRLAEPELAIEERGRGHLQFVVLR